MTSSIRKLLRLFVLLMLTVFVTETVYATGVMTATDLVAKKIEKQLEHCHEQQVDSQIYLNYQMHDKQSSQSHCKGSSHCVACFSIILPATLSASTMHQRMIATISFVEIYQTPTSAQPQKPPIA